MDSDSRTFSYDESVDNIPPPPKYSDDSYCDDEEGYFDEVRFDQNGNDTQDEFEHTLSEHELYAGPYEPAQIPEEELEESNKKRSIPKKILLSTLALVLFIAVAALGSVTVQRNKAREKATAIAASQAALQAVTNSPTKNPTDKPSETPTMAPSVSMSPTITDSPSLSGEPTMTPSFSTAPSITGAPTITAEPTGECVDEISVSKECYTFRESIEITFTTCDAEKENWIGFFRPNATDESGTMRRGAYYWELPCGGHGMSCETPMKSGTITISANLPLGPHQIHTIGGTVRPYHSTTSSEVFFVRRFCRSGSDPSYPSYSDKEKDETHPEYAIGEHQRPSYDRGNGYGQQRPSYDRPAYDGSNGNGQGSPSYQTNYGNPSYGGYSDGPSYDSYPSHARYNDRNPSYQENSNSHAKYGDNKGSMQAKYEGNTYPSYANYGN